MKIEYLADAAPECPLIRLYGVDEAGFSRLLELATALSEGGTATFDLADDAAFTSVNVRALMLGYGDGGIRETAKGEFAWLLPARDWETVARLLRPLAEASAEEVCWQWLDEGLAAPPANIAVLASHSRDGRW